jgi:hypothetical protein
LAVLKKLPSSFSSSTFRITPSGLFPIRINLKLWILQTVGRTPWTGDQPWKKLPIGNKLAFSLMVVKKGYKDKNSDTSDVFKYPPHFSRVPLLEKHWST